MYSYKHWTAASVIVLLSVMQVSASFQSSLPRYNFKGQRVDNTFAPSDSNYYSSLIIMAIPFFVLAFVLLVVGFAFIFLRICCGCCGKTYFTKSHCTRLTVIGISLLVLGGSIASLVANSTFSKGVDDSFTTIIDTTDNMISMADQISASLSKLSEANTTTVQNSITSIRNGAVQFQTTTNKAHNTVNTYDNLRKGFGITAFTIAGVTAIVGLLGAIFTRGKLCLLFAFLGVFSLIFLWVSFGIHLPTSVAISDFCTAIEVYIDDSASSTASVSNSISSTGLDQIMKCLANDTYSPAYELSFQGATSTLNLVNNYTVSCCGIYYTSENISKLDVTQFPAEYQPQIQVYVTDYSTYSTLLAEVESIGNCSMVRAAYKKIHKSLCRTTLDSANVILVFVFIMGIVLIPGVYFGLRAWKRFSHTVTMDTA